MSPVEPEHRGSFWKHPVVLYVLGTVIIFLGLVVLGWLAIENNWLPKR